MNVFFYKATAVFLMFCITSCVIKNSKVVSNKNEKNSNHCKVIIPQDSVSLKIITGSTLLEDYKKQKYIIEKFSSQTNYPFDLEEVRGYYTGIFSCGVIELNITRIDGDHGIYLEGLVDETDKFKEELSFLVYGRIPNKKLDSIKYGTKHKMHWIETIVNMEPFDEGYRRLFVVYKIE